MGAKEFILLLIISVYCLLIFAGFMLLSEKYAPNTLNQVIGNDSAIKKLLEFGTRVQENGIGKPLLLYGPSGIGKTCAVHALAYSNGFELIEFSASDYMDAESLSKRLLPATNSRGLFNKRTLILLDEVDERSEKFDSGSERILLEVAKKSKQPVIFIANDYWNRKITFLRDNVEKVEFKRIPKDGVLALMKAVLKKEKRELGEELLAEIATRSNGDVRGALNDLEIMIDAKPELIENLGVRDRKMEIFGVLDKIFTSESFDAAREAYNSTDVDSGMLLNWVDENIPNRYEYFSNIANAYANVAKASFFINQAQRNSQYSLMRYSSVLMSGGVAVSGTHGASYLRSYSFPTNIRSLSKSKASRGDLSKVVKKLIYRLHAHKKDIINEYVYMLKEMIISATKEEGKEKVLEFFERAYSLDKDNVEAILNYS